MKKLLVIIFVFSFINLTACSNTVSGLGKDMDKLGDSIQKSAERLEKRFEDKESEDKESSEDKD